MLLLDVPPTKVMTLLFVVNGLSESGGDIGVSWSEPLLMHKEEE